jgi:hypothetical protein
MDCKSWPTMRAGIVSLMTHLIVKVHGVDIMNTCPVYLVKCHGTCGVNIDLCWIGGCQRVANTRSETTRIRIRWQFSQLEWSHDLLFLIAFGSCGNQGPDVVPDESSSCDTVPTAHFQSQMWHEPHVLVFEGIGCHEVSHVQETVRVTIHTSHQRDHLPTETESHNYVKE